jgi:hypothetical protein
MVRTSAYAGLGMTPAELAARYRDYAGKCLLVAQKQENANEKLALIDMAQAWIALAEQAERNETLFLVYETPTKDAPAKPEVPDCEPRGGT